MSSYLEYQQYQREEASVVLESRQEPDTYHLLKISGKLCSRYTGIPVENYMDKTSPIGQIEFHSFDQVQTREGEFLGFWLSAPHVLRSTDPNHLQAKLIVYETSEIEGRQSVLNRTLLFDIDYEECLDITNKIAEKFGSPLRFSDVEEARANTIFAERKLPFDEWLMKITDIINDERQWDMVRNGQDFEIEERTLRWVSKGEAQAHMGQNPGSCPPTIYGTASEVVQNHSIVLEGKFVKNCGKCGKTINKVIFKGYQCSCGGIYEGC